MSAPPRFHLASRASSRSSPQTMIPSSSPPKPSVAPQCPQKKPVLYHGTGQAPWDLAVPLSPTATPTLPASKTESLVPRERCPLQASAPCARAHPLGLALNLRSLPWVPRPVRGPCSELRPPPHVGRELCRGRVCTVDRPFQRFIDVGAPALQGSSHARRVQALICGALSPG